MGTEQGSSWSSLLLRTERRSGGWCFTHQYKNTTQFCFYADLATTQNTNQQKGVINAEDINILSSPTQLKHDGFFRFVTCSADVNSQTNEGAPKFTSHAVGDFYAFWLEIMQHLLVAAMVHLLLHPRAW